MRASVCVVLVGMVVGCASGGGDDDDLAFDAGDNDAAVPDAAAPDAAVPDGAVSDAAVPDAAVPDAVVPDAAVPDAPPAGACNPVSQTGCLPGQKCAYIVDVLSPEMGHVGCTADGADAIGDPCVDAIAPGTSDSCAKGGHCYNGFCREICTTLADTCSGGQCAAFVDGMGNPYPLEWCLPSCDPLAQDCMVPSEACFLIGGGGLCLGHGSAAEGDPCVYANSCDTGTQCFGPAGAAVCRRLCGTIDEVWGTDAGGDLTWPTCCGSGCGATVDCGLSNEMCWIVSDGAGGVADVGVCMTDVDASNPGGSTPWTCDCTSPAAEKCAFD